MTIQMTAEQRTAVESTADVIISRGDDVQAATSDSAEHQLTVTQVEVSSILRRVWRSDERGKLVALLAELSRNDPEFLRALARECHRD